MIDLAESVQLHKFSQNRNIEMRLKVLQWQQCRLNDFSVDCPADVVFPEAKNPPNQPCNGN
jgi:hypothetical protein